MRGPMRDPGEEQETLERPVVGLPLLWWSIDFRGSGGVSLGAPGHTLGVLSGTTPIGHLLWTPVCHCAAVCSMLPSAGMAVSGQTCLLWLGGFAHYWVVQAAILCCGVAPDVVLLLQFLHKVAELFEGVKGLFGFLNGELGVLLLFPLRALVHGKTGTCILHVLELGVI